MTGDHALLCVELAIMRVKDRHAAAIPCDDNIVQVLFALANEIAALRANRADAASASDKSPVETQG